MGEHTRHTAGGRGFAGCGHGRGVGIFAVVVFVFYQYVLPELSPQARSGLRAWLPLISINEALVWVICALGLNIVVGYAGLLDLGFVAFWAIGGYTAGWLMSGFFHTERFHLLSSVSSEKSGIHLSFWLVLLVAAVVCAVCGVLIGAPTLRLRSDYLALVTLGFGEIIPQVFLRGEDIFGMNISNGSKGIAPVDPVTSLRFDDGGITMAILAPLI